MKALLIPLFTLLFLNFGYSQTKQDTTLLPNGIGLTFSPLYSKQTIAFKDALAYSGGISGLFGDG